MRGTLRLEESLFVYIVVCRKATVVRMLRLTLCSFIVGTAEIMEINVGGNHLRILRH